MAVFIKQQLLYGSYNTKHYYTIANVRCIKMYTKTVADAL